MRILLKHKRNCEILNKLEINSSSYKTFNFVIQCLLTIYWLPVKCRLGLHIIDQIH